MVTGNSDYTLLPRLPAVLDDALLMADALGKAGFDVTVERNFRMPDFVSKAEAAFLQEVQPGDFCVFYFSGHAVQVADEDNYLLPVNFDPNDSRTMQSRAYRVRRLQQALEEKGAALKIFVLEAPKQDLPLQGTASGLMEPKFTDSTETLFAYAAQTGQGAIPAPGLFTHSLAASLLVPGRRLSDVFDAAKREVGTKTSEQQIPYVNDNFVKQDVAFFFIAPPPPPPPKAPQVTTTQPRRDDVNAGVPRRNRRDGQEYVWIPAGKFKMGCVPQDKRCEPDERPQHPVEIRKGFWMGRNEVSVMAYKRFVQDPEQQKSGRKRRMPKAPLANPRWLTDYPMVNVAWEDAYDFCTWAGGRLPTEAEWEYAARSGVDGDIYPLNDENSRDRANFLGKKGNDQFEDLAPIRSFDPNSFQLYDIAGNVWEWVGDWYSADYYSSSAPVNPKGPPTGRERVARGGSYSSDPSKHLRISIRKPEGQAANHIGMRCVLDDTPATRKLLGLAVP